MIEGEVEGVNDISNRPQNYVFSFLHASCASIRWHLALWGCQGGSWCQFAGCLNFEYLKGTLWPPKVGFGEQLLYFNYYPWTSFPTKHTHTHTHTRMHARMLPTQP